MAADGYLIERKGPFLFAAAHWQGPAIFGREEFVSMDLDDRVVIGAQCFMTIPSSSEDDGAESFVEQHLAVLSEDLETHILSGDGTVDALEEAVDQALSDANAATTSWGGPSSKVIGRLYMSVIRLEDTKATLYHSEGVSGFGLGPSKGTLLAENQAGQMQRSEFSLTGPVALVAGLTTSASRIWLESEFATETLSDQTSEGRLLWLDECMKRVPKPSSEDTVALMLIVPPFDLTPQSF